MKSFYASMILGILCILGTTCLVGCQVYKWARAYPSDNIVEEFGEEVIEHYTGWDIDLTPFSKED